MEWIQADHLSSHRKSSCSFSASLSLLSLHIFFLTCPLWISICRPLQKKYPPLPEGGQHLNKAPQSPNLFSSHGVQYFPKRSPLDSIRSKLQMDKMSNDWEEEPEWRRLAVAGTQFYMVWEHLVLAEAAEAPGTTFTCCTSTKVQILTWIVHKVHCCWRKHSLTGKRSQKIGMFRPIRMDHTNCLQVAIKSIQFNGEDWQWLARRSCPSFSYRCVSDTTTWVLILLNLCLILLYMSLVSHTTICVFKLLHMCPHASCWNIACRFRTSWRFSVCWLMDAKRRDKRSATHTTIIVLSYYYISHHTTMLLYESSYYNICFLILLPGT